MRTELNREISNFSWKNILLKSQEFEQSLLNPSIFTLKYLADIALREDDIVSIHPGNRKSLNCVAVKLSEAVSCYYRQPVFVTITEELIITVQFS